jgi:hypothetical protein
MGPIAGLDVLEKRKSLVSTGIRIPNRTSRSLVAIPTTALAHVKFIKDFKNCTSNLSKFSLGVVPVASSSTA